MKLGREYMDPDNLRSLLDIFTRGKYQTSEDLPTILEAFSSYGDRLQSALTEGDEAWMTPEGEMTPYGNESLMSLVMGIMGGGPKNLSQKVIANSPKHSSWVSDDYIPTWTSYGKKSSGSVPEILTSKTMRQSIEERKMMKNIINHKIAEGRKLMEKYKEAERVLKNWRKTHGWE